MALDGQRAAEQKAKALENALEEERYKGASNAKVQALAAELQGARDEVRNVSMFMCTCSGRTLFNSIAMHCLLIFFSCI